MSQREATEVIVVGGGQVGLLLAGALAHAGIDIRLVERQSLAGIAAAESDGRTLALLAGSVTIARRVGAWDRLTPATEAINRVEVVDVEGGGQVHYDTAVARGGALGVGVEHTNLRKALAQTLLDRAPPTAFVQGEVAAMRRDRDAVELRLTCGRQLAAPLVVGADGRGSRVRELARIAVDRWTYDQSALAMVLRHERHHRGMVREWLRRGGPLATLPLPGRRSGVTWVERSKYAQALAARSAADLLAEFAAATGGVLGRLAIESGPSVYPLGAQHARTYVAARVALVGDAAHGVHPIHAQGFNMGVADVGALIDALLAARARGADLGSGDTLLPYARARRADNSRRLWLTDGMVRLFTADLAPLRAARSLALDAVERLPPLKRLAMRHGMQTG
jgi:2-octaprenyl-6-methoxyphenol hydroxylase